MVRELARQSEGPRFESRHTCVVCMFVCLSVFVCCEYTETYVLVKSVESKVPTALAYDVARNSVECKLRCLPRHLTRVLNYETYVAVLKLYLRLEIGSRKTFKPNKSLA